MKNSSQPIKPIQILVMLVIFGLVAFLRTQGYGVNPPPAEPAPSSLPQIQVERGPTETESPATSRPKPRRTPRPATPTAASPAEEMSEFDFFVLALSWSPDYCATSGGNDPQQCSMGKKLGFVLHGLWPQYEKGYPSDCSTEKLPDSVQAQFAGLFPSEKLFDHEWEKHGTCTGLTPEDYLQLSQQFKTSLTIPAQFRSPEKPFRTNSDALKALFLEANPAFGEDSFEVSCSGSGRYLKEIYVCFSRAGEPTACSAEMRRTALKSCQAADFQVRNTR